MDPMSIPSASPLVYLHCDTPVLNSVVSFSWVDGRIDSFSPYLTMAIHACVERCHGKSSFNLTRRVSVVGTRPLGFSLVSCPTFSRPPRLPNGTWMVDLHVVEVSFFSTKMEPSRRTVFTNELASFGTHGPPTRHGDTSTLRLRMDAARHHVDERMEEDEQDTEPCSQGTKRRKGCYVPRFRSANFALLVVLHRNQHKGVAHMGKTQLLQEATVGDLCEKPPSKNDASHFRNRTGNIHGNGSARNATQRNYYADGWQGFSKMLKEQPPLVAAWSNPRRISLTPKGWEVAAKLHAAAEAAGLCRCGWDARTEDASEPPPAILDAQMHALRPDGSTEASIQNQHKRKHNRSQHRGYRTTVPRSIREDSVQELMDPSYGPETAPSKLPNEDEPTHKNQPEGGSRENKHGDPVQEQLVRVEMDRMQHRRSEWMLSEVSPPSQTQPRAPPLHKGERLVEQYEVVLLIDQREQYSASHPLMSRIEEFSKMGVQAELRVLPQGDATWILRKKSTGTEWISDYVLERKRVDDLFSSIKSKRYDMQKHLMARSSQRHPMYLIEGDVNAMEVAAALKTASFTTAVCDGFKVYHTDNVSSTLRLLGRISHSITRKYRKMKGPSDMHNLLPLYEVFEEESRNNRSDVSVAQVFGHALLQVPGIGPETAEAILKAYPTIACLYKEYQNVLEDVGTTHGEGLKHCHQLLGNLPVAGVGNRKVGSVKSKAVFEKLFGSLAP